MKKITLMSMIALIYLSTLSNNVLANSTKPNVATNNTTEAPAEVKVMLNRLNQIKEMDKNSLNSTQKKALRAEVKEIKNTLKSTGNGVYLSVGAIIIILLILILIL